MARDQIAGEVSDNDEVEDVYLASVESSDPGDGRDILPHGELRHGLGIQCGEPMPAIEFESTIAPWPMATSPGEWAAVSGAPSTD